MKILLTTLNSKYVHTNLALRYLYYTVNTGYDVQIKEFTINEELFKILADIEQIKADIIAFSCYIWNISYTLEICSIIKKVKPETKIILGGPEVSHHTHELMNEYDFIDFILLGESEETFPRLIGAVTDGSNLFKDISGIEYREGNGEIKVNGQPAIVQDLSKIPSPYQGDLCEYNQKVAYLESSRGCPYNCSYCLSSTTKGVRYFPLERTKEEIKRLINAGVKQVKFVDRTFNCDKQRAMDIWKFLLENKKETTFHFEISGHLLDSEMIEFLAQVPEGYFDFEIGVQSTFEETNCAINRRTDFTKLSEAIKKIREKNNIHIHLDLIAGLPYETYERFKESFDYVYNLDPHMLQLGFLKLLKGSQIRSESDVHGYKFLDNPPYEVLENKYISFSEIIKLKRIEEVLEVYKNSGRFENSLTFILKNFNKRPFKIFDDLSEYWLKIGAYTRKIGTEESYDIMHDFYLDYIGEKVEHFREVLKLDYLINMFGAKTRWWIKKYTFKGIKNVIRNILSDIEIIDKYLPELKDVSLGERFKRVHFEVFGLDVIDKVASGPVLVMFERNIGIRGSKVVKYHKIDSKYFNPDSLE